MNIFDTILYMVFSIAMYIGISLVVSTYRLFTESSSNKVAFIWGALVALISLTTILSL